MRRRASSASCADAKAGLDAKACLIECMNYTMGNNANGRRHSLVRGLGTQAVANEIRESIAIWQLAGLRLYLTVQMALHHENLLRPAGGASLRKARELLEDRTLSNRADLDAAWRSHRSVAVLAAAAIHVANELAPRDLHPWFGLKLVLDSRPWRILEVSRALQDFAVGFRNPHSSRPLLDAAALWLVPAIGSVELQSTVPQLADAWQQRLYALCAQRGVTP
jgi:hypothetical protein